MAAVGGIYHPILNHHPGERPRGKRPVDEFEPCSADTIQPESIPHLQSAASANHPSHHEEE
jgi:hypothetical protein